MKERIFMFFRLFLTDLKRVKQLFLRLLLTTVILAAGITAIILLSNQLLYTDNSIETVKVGLVADASSNYAKMAYSMVADMDSYRTTCEFVEVASESTGEQMLQSGEIKALIVIPDNIINSIMYGEDNPITVMYNEDGTLETHTLNEVFKSTSSMLATAQAATTIIYRTAYNLNLPADVLSTISSETDSMYLDYVLNRMDIFTDMELHVTGNYNPYQYYTASGILLLLFFSGIVFLAFIKGNSDALIFKLKLKGIKKAHIWISQYLAIFLSISILYVFLFLLCRTIGEISGYSFLQMHFYGLISAFPAIALITFILLLIGYLPAGYAGSCTILFLTIFVLAYTGGGIVPIRILPDFIQNFADKTPYYHLLTQLCKGFYG
jgi:hypothetical protein